MAKTLQFRRDSTANLASVTGAVGEIFIDTTKKTVVVMDGSTAGGYPLELQGAGTGATGAAGANGATGPIAGSRIGATGGAVSSITPDASLYDLYVVNGLGASGIINTPTGSPVDGQRLTIRIEDNGSARGLSFNGATGAYRAIGVTLPTTTTASKVIYVGCQYNSFDSFWDVVAVATQA